MSDSFSRRSVITTWLHKLHLLNKVVGTSLVLEWKTSLHWSKIVYHSSMQRQKCVDCQLTQNQRVRQVPYRAVLRLLRWAGGADWPLSYRPVEKLPARSRAWRRGRHHRDFGMAAAVGFKFPISAKLNFFVEYEFVYGFVEVTDQWKGTTSTGRETLNVGLNFQL